MSPGAGRLALVLHTHMPYVEGFGTWPFGEEWLWEAMAGSYLPLLDVLDEHPHTATLSLTPVLADQLAAPGVGERFLAFLDDLRERSHELDLAATDDLGVRGALEDSREQYRRAARSFRARGGELVAGLGAHARWTSAATHAILPLLATGAGMRLQLEAGIDSHRARFGAWDGGLWLPECAYAPWIEEPLARAGVRHTCVDLTDTGLDPHVVLRSAAGPLLVGIDRPALELAWGPGGYPAAGAYRDRHRRTARDHRAWSNDGSPYDPERGRAQARLDAEDFVARIRERVADGGLCVCAFDTELFGHWWHEGPAWLAAVLAQARRRGLAIVPLDDALADAKIADAPVLPVTSWGSPRDLRTWSGPAVADVAFAQRAAELALFARGGRPSATARRELLHLQASDWAFLIAGDTAGPYPRERIDAHRARLEAALRGEGDPAAPRHLAPELA